MGLLTTVRRELLGGLRNQFVSYWTLDETSGTSAADSIGGNSGVWTPDASGVHGAGEINGGGIFDGTHAVNMGSPAALNITGALTYLLWFNTTYTANYQILLACRTGGSSSQSARLQINLSSGTLEFDVISGASTVTATSPSRVTNGAWHMAVGVYIPSTSVSLYIDAALVSQITASVPASLNAGPFPFNIGRGADGLYTNGSIDEVGVAAAAISLATIKQLYASGAGSRPF